MIDQAKQHFEQLSKPDDLESISTKDTGDLLSTFHINDGFANQIEEVWNLCTRSHAPYFIELSTDQNTNNRTHGNQIRDQCHVRSNRQW